MQKKQYGDKCFVKQSKQKIGGHSALYFITLCQAVAEASSDPQGQGIVAKFILAWLPPIFIITMWAAGTHLHTHQASKHDAV